MQLGIAPKITLLVWSVRGFLALVFFAGVFTQNARLSGQKAPVTDKDIVPVLQQKCFQCHGEALKMGNLDLRTRESMLKGGDKGPAIVAGNADQSMLMHRVTGTVAP